MAGSAGSAAWGVLPVTARYLGDAAAHPATSPPVNLVVSTPGQPIPKVKARVTLKGPKAIRKGKRATLQVLVAAPQVTPSGRVRVRVRGAVKRTYTLTLNRYGSAKLRLPKAKRMGKIRVRVRYLGDAAVRPSRVKRHVITVRRW